MTPELYNLYVKGFRHLRFSHRHPTAIRWLQGVSTIVRTHYNLCKKKFRPAPFVSLARSYVVLSGKNT